MNGSIIKEIDEKAHAIRMNVLEMAFSAGKAGAHIGGAFSMAEILATLFFGNIIKYDVQHKDDPNRDRFILSKGHTALAYYAALAQAGFFPIERLSEFETDLSPFGTHISKHPELGMDYASGSLGHGLALGVGAAIAGRIDGSSYHTFVLSGDGECNEGSIWEAAMLAGHMKLDKLVWIIDRNHMQCDGFTAAILSMPNLYGMISNCGWDVLEVNGHDPRELLNALNNCIQPHELPIAIIANTVKGRGVSFIENNKKWHHGCVGKEEYEAALKELKVVREDHDENK